ncbi:MAG: VOC family protein, partial [archaeon]|nr:VOC family protein [archaeon]
AEFYTSVFPDSKIIYVTQIHDTPSGDCDIVSYSIAGLDFMAISAGPLFKINPSISFFVNFDPSNDPHARKNLDALWEKLTPGGTILMPLQKYPFSEWYGWVQDKYGVSWQLILTHPEGESRTALVPSLLFTKDHAGQAEEAIDFYVSVFKDARRGQTARYPAGAEYDKEGTIMFADFMLENQWFAAMDSAYPHAFGFNEGVSLIVECETQGEIDYYWDKLSAVPEAEQCGWLKDKFGVSWQIVPKAMNEMMQTNDPEKKKRVTQAFLKMKKFDIGGLKKAYDGNP